MSSGQWRSLDWNLACWRAHVVDNFSVRMEPVNQKNFVVVTLMFVALAATGSALAQNSSSMKKDAAKGADANDASQPNPNDFIELLRKDVRSQKKQIIAGSLMIGPIKVGTNFSRLRWHGQRPCPDTNRSPSKCITTLRA